MKYEILKNYKSNYAISKSNFICLLIKINDVSNVESILKNIKLEYKDASHYCYTYIIGNKEKCSDDGEPSGTAGIPMLNVLKKNNLINILCVVVRYFGGVKLGAGGLLRAYSTSVSKTLTLANINPYIEYKTVEIITNYENLNNIEYILRNYKIIKKDFSDEIKLYYRIPVEKIEGILEILKNICIKMRAI